MRIIQIIFLVLFWANVVQAQQYHIFSYNGREGLTNNTGDEVIAPHYDYHRYIDAKKIWILIPSYDQHKNTCTFSEKIKKVNYYKEFSNDAVMIEEEHFSLVDDQKTVYLLSESTERKIPLPEASYSFINWGTRYIVCKYYPKEGSTIKTKKSIKQSHKNKGGISDLTEITPVVPPKIMSEEEYYKNNYAILANNYNLDIIINGSYTSCKPLIAYDESASYQERVISLNPDPAGILLSDGATHILYDSALNKIAAFKQKVPTEFSERDGAVFGDEQVDTLLNKCSQLLHTTVVFNIPAMVSMSGEREKPKPKPILTESKINGGTIISIKETTGVYKKILFTKNTVALNENNNEITITQTGKKESINFYVAMDKRKILLPKKYVQQFKLVIY